jgi:hypothetical protein
LILAFCHHWTWLAHLLTGTGLGLASGFDTGVSSVSLVFPIVESY